MDITNPGVLTLVIVRTLTALTVAIFVLPITIKELRRKQHDPLLYSLRWFLFILSVLYVLPAIFPIWNGITRLDSTPVSELSTIANYWQGIREVSIGAMIIVIYYLSRLLSKR